MENLILVMSLIVAALALLFLRALRNGKLNLMSKPTENQVMFPLMQKPLPGKTNTAAVPLSPPVSDKSRGDA